MKRLCTGEGYVTGDFGKPLAARPKEAWASDPTWIATTAQPHRCPVCEGRGKVPMGFYSYGRVSTEPNANACRSCNGSGVLWR